MTYDLTLAGLSVGAAAALSGIGLIVTHRATGVLNFAHGAIAMLCAFLLRQLAVVWDWPLWAAAVLVLLGVAPAIGLALERWVFRPLATSGNDPAQTLVASIGVFVLLVGAAAMLWGTGAQEDAPTLIPADPWGQLAVAGAIAPTVWAVTRWTRFGGELRAVVDNRPLAVLGGIDADRVAAAGWAFGAFTAGLTGALLAPYVRLDPYGLPLLVMEVMAVAVAARLRLLSVAVVTALGIGVAQSQLTRVHPSGWAEPLLQAVGANLFVVALLVAALALPGIGGKGELPRAVTRRALPTPPAAWLVAAVLFLLPLGFAGSDLQTSVQVPALAIVLLSLVVVTGRAGQLALGQAAFAGLGALFASLLAMGRFPGLPQLPPSGALLLSVILVAPLGLLTAVPAIGRHGLALALATFAVGVGASRFVFAQPYAASGLTPERPAGFGSDRAYYTLELLLLTGVLILVTTLRRGRSGRALAALRDHEAGASAAGVPVPALKVAAFVAGAGIAALGGGLLALGTGSFDPAAFDPVRGLLWFAAVVVLGADSPLGALAGAALLVGLDAGTRGGMAALVIGTLAVLIGRFPTGPQARVRAAVVRGWGRRRLTVRGARVREGLRGGAARAGAGGRPGRSGGRHEAMPATGSLPCPSETTELGEGSSPNAGAAGTEAATDRGGLPEARGAEVEAGGPPRARTTKGATVRPPEGSARALPQAPTQEADTDGPSGPAVKTDADEPPNGPTAETDADGPPQGPKASPDAHAGAGGPPPAQTPDSAPDRPPGAQRAATAEARAAAAVGDSSVVPAVPVLSARHLTVAFDGRPVLDGVDMAVPAGQITAVVGPNGAGKSTLFHCLAGTLRPGSGHVLFGERDITRLPAHARTRLGVARTFQQLVVFPSLTVAENLRIGAEQGRVRDPDATRRMLALFGLRGDRGTADLPTGTLRHVELGRALAGRPHVLLLDEPAAGLDDSEVADLAVLLRALAADGTALLVVEHDLDLVARLADTVHLMTAGRITASGPAALALNLDLGRPSPGAASPAVPRPHCPERRT
nr:ATP-binding cassette domain-containing protein [Streptomyces sp. SID8379]